MDDVKCICGCTIPPELHDRTMVITMNDGSAINYLPIADHPYVPDVLVL